MDKLIEIFDVLIRNWSIDVKILVDLINNLDWNLNCYPILSPESLLDVNRMALTKSDFKLDNILRPNPLSLDPRFKSWPV